MYKKILVAVNDNARALKALSYAEEMAENMSSQLTILFVLKDSQIDSSKRPEVLEAEAVKIKAKIKKLYPDLPAKGQLIAREGKNVASIIVSVAEETESDLIILGSRRLPGANSVIRRSVANAVISGSNKPVLIV